LLDKFQLLLAVHNPVLRAEIVDITRMHHPNVIIYEKDNGASALLALNQESLDLVILQDELPILNGIEVAEKYKESQTGNEKFILFSESRQIEHFQKAKRLHFLGYLTTANLENEIKECLTSVYNGNCFISKSMQKLIYKFGELTKQLASLSPTEKLFLNEINEGKNFEEISDKLVLSSKSISQITSSISKKLEIDPKDQAIKEWTRKNKSIFH